MRILTSSALAIALSVWTMTTPVVADDRIPARGDFSAVIDFNTLTLMPVGDNCLLKVEGKLEFTGTLEGMASAETRALVLASCDEVAANPPGTFKDLFRSRLEFDGTVDGRPAIGDITYQGITEVGGDIKGQMLVSLFSDDLEVLRGRFTVEAVVAAGGSYEGFIKSRQDD